MKRQKLIAEINEGRGLASTAKLEVEQTAIECQGLINITDFESDMVETYGARLL